MNISDRIRFLLFCSLKLIKIILGRQVEAKSFFIDLPKDFSFPVTLEAAKENHAFVNDIRIEGKRELARGDFFPNDNAVDHDTYKLLNGGTTARTGLKSHEDVSKLNYCELLNRFIRAARIPEGWRNGGFYYCGYVKEEQRWCMPSWIWTNAALIRYFLQANADAEAKRIADKFLDAQLDCGGWLVRYDFVGREGICPVIAPNDSAYLANNGLLTVFLKTGEKKYLHAAERCADWIMCNKNSDNLVFLGYNPMTQQWDTSANIVDIGFTAALFCSLYNITRKSEYLRFADDFVAAYIKAFYIGEGRFSSSLDKNGNKRGTGVFARGQAWALEGLIPYYKLTGDEKIKKIIDDVVVYMLRTQSANGAWVRLIRPGIMSWFSGYDCKGVSVIAYSLNEWAEFNKELAPAIDKSVNLAVDWCQKHTETSGPAAGGIFSWCEEGAGKVSHCSTFVYASSYLYEIIKKKNLS